MASDLLSIDHPDSAEAATLMDRLRFAAESLAAEFEALSPVDAERLIFGVVRQFLSDAQVAQFVPTLATRRARQLLRSYPPGETFRFGDLSADQPSAIEVTLAEELAEVGGTSPTAGEVPAAATAPKPPAHYANEAKRLLEQARALRANALEPAGRRSRTVS